MLRPAPAIALTATATPTVQEDIVRQLGMKEDAARFICGFRRTNIAVEMVEIPPSARKDAVLNLLSSDPSSLPAIVYTPTRKESELLASSLSKKVKASAYHAGIPGDDRARIQKAFLTGDLDVVVATIAFGMGIDKPDIRTVIHTGLPGTLEQYYQEIGRAGRDGNPSQAILLHSYADRRTHKFFQKRDYPKIQILDGIYSTLPNEPVPLESLRERSSLSEETFDKAIEKLWIHGGALIDPAELVTKGDSAFREPYLKQREMRLIQLDDITRFANSHDCRMVRMVRYFGDQEDKGEPCGLCDFCVPEKSRLKRFRPPDLAEKRLLTELWELLRSHEGQSTGQIHRLMIESKKIERRDFEMFLGGLARSELVALKEDQFEKEGKVIKFQRTFLTNKGSQTTAIEPDSIRLPKRHDPVKKTSRKSKTMGKARSETSKSVQPKTLSVRDGRLFFDLKEWRLKEARKKRIPAFRIMRDQVLLSVAVERPKDPDALLQISGMGPKLVEKYGARILGIVQRFQ